MVIGLLLHYTIISHDSRMDRQLKKLYLDKGSPTFLAGSVDKLFKAYRANKFFKKVYKIHKNRFGIQSFLYNHHFCY